MWTKRPHRSSDAAGWSVRVWVPRDSVRAIADNVALLHGGIIKWTGPVAEMDDSGDPYLDQFIHGRADGPIEAVR